jgi:hypothetical protein
MAAIMTLTYDDQGPIKKIILDWTSHTDGTGTVTTKKIIGSLIKGITDPGTAAPTDNYDIGISDDLGLDVLGKCLTGLANRDTLNAEEVYFNLLQPGAVTYSTDSYPVVCGRLNIEISNAGDTKTGQLILYYRAA